MLEKMFYVIYWSDKEESYFQVNKIVTLICVLICTITATLGEGTGSDVCFWLTQRRTNALLITWRYFQTSMIGKIARATIFNVVDLLLLCFDATNLGDEKDLVTVSENCEVEPSRTL